MLFIKDKKKLSRIRAELHWYGCQQRGKRKKKTNNTEDKNYYFLVAVLIPKPLKDYQLNISTTSLAKLV